MTLLIYALIPVSTAIQRINIRLPMSRVSEIIFFFQLWIIQKQTSRTYIASLQYMCFLILPLIGQDYHFLTGYSIIATIIVTQICKKKLFFFVASLCPPKKRIWRLIWSIFFTAGYFNQLPSDSHCVPVAWLLRYISFRTSVNHYVFTTKNKI